MADSIDLCKLFFTDNEKGENFYSSHCRNESMAEVVPHKIAGSLIFRDLPLLSLSLQSCEFSTHSWNLF